VEHVHDLILESRHQEASKQTFSRPFELGLQVLEQHFENDYGVSNPVQRQLPSASELEESLEDYLNRAQEWNCIVLIDDIDSFIGSAALPCKVLSSCHALDY
jgi:hypothetical protein